MTCKDCLYYECCSTLNDEFKKYPKDFIHSDLTVRNCTKFKNKADYVEVKHDYWKAKRSPADVFYSCSECRCTYCYADPEIECEYNYCPNCGAKMDLKGGAD